MNCLAYIQIKKRKIRIDNVTKPRYIFRYFLKRVYYTFIKSDMGSLITMHNAILIQIFYLYQK